jgi:polysaccharide export outer membrane protein
MFRSALLILVSLTLSACGSAYISQDVVASEDGSVQIVPLTQSTAQAANSSPYRPKQIPASFYQVTETPGGIRGNGEPPEPAFNEQQRPSELELRAPPHLSQMPYRIGVGDVVLLATKSAKDSVAELSGLLAAQNSRQGYTVQDDGAIAVPDVGRISIAGLTLEQAEAAVFQALIEQSINPSFSLEISKFNSQRVSIGGAVAKPTIIPISLTGLRLDEALSAAGGISTPDREFVLIRLYREGNLYQIPFSEYLRRAEMQKVLLTAGDSIFVDTEFELAKAEGYFAEQIALSNLRRSVRMQALSELQTQVGLRRAALNEKRDNFLTRVKLDSVDRDYVYLTGEVNKPGRFDIPFGRSATLADALYSEGGFNIKTGDPSEIYVLRGTKQSDAVTAYHLDARNVANLIIATQFSMRPNDVIFVAEQPITRWNRVVQQIVPSLITSGVVAATR